MKKIRLFFLAAMLLAVGSAFTSVANSEVEYVLIGDTYEPVSEQPPGGECLATEFESSCKYVKTGDEGPEPFKNPNNFDPIDSYVIWQP